ncbi:unnamed protein product [Caenorhabditis bovis]|uniref:OTU domain-containing protein n=1 Tax=Caenorhabditis bovis TaxID=2654633 RepID=A0A8S1F008_9PELO|nr:unnamed protein product [Caenorhabditis bovis]
MSSDEEENPILARHRKEKKELREKANSLKKTAKCGNKQKQKETNAEIAKMEKEMEERHKKELEEQVVTVQPQPEANALKPEDILPEEGEFYREVKITGKAAKRQAKLKAKEEKWKEAMKADKAAEKTSERHLEKECISEILKEHKLVMVDISADGDCMYNALSHQLAKNSIDIKPDKLREMCATYMKNNEEEFMPFIEADEHGNVNWEKYLNGVRCLACVGGVWGGELELNALSRCLKRAIEVFKVDGNRIYGEEFMNEELKPLRIVYLRRAYALGEHYNSTKMFRFSLYLLLVFAVENIHTYKKYAKPITIMEPDKNGVYAYDMNIYKKLTMSYNNDNVAKHATPVDYDYKTQTWSKREPDQLKPCFANYSLNINSQPDDQNRLEDVLVADGLHKRVITINGDMPGEPIVVPYMSEVWIRVRNSVLLDSTTIHVHGIDKHGMWFMDGVAFVQQCPIQSTNGFEYRFIADNKGTHWYHGHLQVDRGDGIAGGFVVIDPKDRSVPTLAGNRITPDVEYFILLQDWAIKSGEESWMQLEDKTMKWFYGYDNFDKCWEPTRTTDGGNVGGAIPLSSILINNKGWYDQEIVKSQPFNLPLERFLVKPNQNVLFRIVNGGVAQELMFYFEDHEMVVVAADGDEVVPMKVDKLIVFPGERYDVLIRTLDKPTKKSYKMQVETVQKYFFDWNIIPIDYGFGFLEYEGENLPEDVSTPNLMHPDCTANKKCLVLNCPFEEWKAQPNFTCVAYDKLQNPKVDEIDKEILQDTPFTENYEEYFINMHHDSQMDQFMFQFPWGIPYYHENDMDSISTDCSNTLCANDTSSDNDNRCRCFYHLKHKLNNTVQITIYNMGLGGFLGSGYAHPFHMHGHHFYVMKVGWPKYNSTGFINELNSDINCDGPYKSCNGRKWKNTNWLNGAVEGMNTKNPTKRDTVTIPVGGYITIRFKATNPGWWFAHCHLELHLMGGTGYAYSVGDHNQIYMPPDNFPKDCGIYKVDKLPELRLPTEGSSSLTSILMAITSVFIMLMIH